MQDDRKVLRRARLIMLVVLLLLAAGAGRTMLSRISNANALEAGTAERAKVYVKTALPKSDAAGQTVSLPGTLQG
ncbi:MAG: efflux transporter periplasmic adaptor subunit, partial [Betaproteobacteria bacterium]